MRRVLLSLLLLCTGVAVAQKPAASTLIVIHAGTLIDGHSDIVRHNVNILVRNNRIESVTEGAERIPGAAYIDLSNATVLPGLIEAHTHVFLQGEDPATLGWDGELLYPPYALRAARATVAARRALEQGFTTIRDMGTEGAGYGDVGIRQAINKGYIPGPRMFVSTLAISTTGGYGISGYAPEVDDQLPKGVQLFDGPVEARKVARDQLAKGADLLKVYMTYRSWVDKRGELVSQPTLTVEELKAIVDEAHGQGKKVACHVYGGIGLHRALDGGCDSIEHGIDLDDNSVAQMKRQGTWLCPTITPYRIRHAQLNTPAAVKEKIRLETLNRSFSRALKAGLKIVFGTDVGAFSWDEPIAQEFRYMVEGGMSPMEAIKSATGNAAEMLDMSAELGVIGPGAYADFIAVAGNPLKDIGELGRVKFVMKDGKVFLNQF